MNILLLLLLLVIRGVESSPTKLIKLKTLLIYLSRLVGSNILLIVDKRAIFFLKLVNRLSKFTLY